jgi:hypothetical protein
MHIAYNNNKRKMIQEKNSGTLGTKYNIRKECITVSVRLRKRLATIGLTHEATAVLSDVMRIRLCACTSAAALVRFVELFL